jgi:hypothetical protein
MIDDIVAELRARGSKQRRNWWKVLAGHKDGSPSVIEGRVFPVLRVAQRRQGSSVTRGAVKRRRREVPPAVRVTGRWSNGR